MQKVGRNDPCLCGSGKKYKKCCELKAGVAKKFHAQVLPTPSQTAQTQETSRVSSLFFKKASPSKLVEEEPPK